MKRYLKNIIISAIKPKVNTTSLGKAKSKLAIQIQKTKASAAKLKQTEFEVKIAKDLTKRRKDFEGVIKAVSKKYKDAGVKITDEGKKIKYDAAKKISKIHDKYTKK